MLGYPFACHLQSGSFESVVNSGYSYEKLIIHSSQQSTKFLDPMVRYDIKLSTYLQFNYPAAQCYATNRVVFSESQYKNIAKTTKKLQELTSAKRTTDKLDYKVALLAFQSPIAPRCVLLRLIYLPVGLI